MSHKRLENIVLSAKDTKAGREAFCGLIQSLDRTKVINLDKGWSRLWAADRHNSGGGKIKSNWTGTGGNGDCLSMKMRIMDDGWGRSSLVVVWLGLVCVLWFGNSGCVAWVWSRGHPCVWLMRIRLATVAVCLARQVAPAWSIRPTQTFPGLILPAFTPNFHSPIALTPSNVSSLPPIFPSIEALIHRLLPLITTST